MKEIKLTQNKIALVDDEDFDFLNQFKWFAHKVRHVYYADRDQDDKTIRMHRVLLNITDKNIHVDHIDGNGLNNQKSNLRISSPKENNRNRRLNKNNSSGYKGVSFDKKSKKWVAYIKINYKHITLGRFDTKETAAKAYNDAALLYHKEFAKINVIKEK